MNTPSAQANIPPMRGSGTERAVIVLILAFFVFRLAMSACFPLIADEAYAVVVSRLPALSYFDHPLLGFDFARFSAWLFGSEASLVVRLPHVIFGSLSAWLIYLVTGRAFGGQAGFWAAAWYSAAPFFFVSAGQFVVPDGPLNFFLLLTLWIVLPELLDDDRPDLRRWAAAGLALGLALLSKYTAVLFGVAAVIVLLSMPRGRRAMATPGPWVAMLIAALCMTPVLIWNAQNGWVSFGFQSGRAFAAAFNPVNFLLVQLGQAGFLLPWLWVIAIFAMVRGLILPQIPAERVFAILAALPVLLFDIIAIFGREVLPHWSMPGFLFAFPLVGLWCVRLSSTLPRLVGRAFAVSSAFVLLLAALVVVQAQTGSITRALGLPQKSDFGWTFLHWDALADDFVRRGILTDPNAFIVPSSWLIGGKAGYALGPRLPVEQPIMDPRHFAYSHDARLDDRAAGYAITAAWPDEVEAAASNLKRIAAKSYTPTGESWTVAQSRAGHPAFVIVVQPVTRK